MPRTKQQMQFMVMGAVIGCGALYALVQFVIMPMLASLNEGKSEIVRIQAELDEVRGVIRDRPLIQGQLKDVQEAIKSAAERIPLPVLGNYLLGMEESIRGCVDETDVDIVTVVRAGEPLGLEGGSGSFSIYKTRVVARSGLHNLARFIHDFESKYPYASVSTLSIIPEEKTPEQHNINFVVSWLIWSDIEKRPDFLLEEPEEKGEKEREKE